MPGTRRICLESLGCVQGPGNPEAKRVLSPWGEGEGRNKIYLIITDISLHLYTFPLGMSLCSNLPETDTLRQKIILTGFLFLTSHLR